MQYVFTVERVAHSVTIRDAIVKLNGEHIVTFDDRSVLGDDGEWHSVHTDGEFILAALYHPNDDIYHYSDRVRAILERKED